MGFRKPTDNPQGRHRITKGKEGNVEHIQLDDPRQNACQQDPADQRNDARCAGGSFGHRA